MIGQVIDREEPPRKRNRITGGHAALSTREMDDLATSLEVNHMILDYFLYQAISACFASGDTPADPGHLSPVDRCLLQVDEFLPLFQRQHPTYQPDEELRFRQILLQMIVLLTRRFTRNPSTASMSSLTELRAANSARARAWIATAARLPTGSHDVTGLEEQLPLPDRDIQQHRTRVLKALGVPVDGEASDERFYGTAGCLSLLDLLPLFMRISAACHRMFDSPPTDIWMHLATEWMLQACLEQYLVFGAHGADAIDEAFAWGRRNQEADLPGSAPPIDDSEGDPFATNMDAEDLELWESIRQRMLAKVLPPLRPDGRTPDIVSHLTRLASEYPLSETEEKIESLLRNMAACTPRPILSQLEHGKLEGMSREETTEFVRSCGLDLSSFYEGILMT